MRIIILEGISTSGKTTIKNKLVKTFTEKGVDFSVIKEDKTLMPVLSNTNKQVSINLLTKVIGEALKEKKDFIIFDRLFFTHIFRTNSSIKDFREIENLVKDHSLLVFLKVAELKILGRITNSRKYRGEEWDEYVSKKGNDEKIHQYYINQQRLLLDLLKKTSLNNKIYNTTNMNFNRITKDILKFLFNDPL